MFSYDLIADVYAVAFAATQGVSLHRNDACSDRHRPRLANHKVKTRHSAPVKEPDFLEAQNFDDVHLQEDDIFFSNADDLSEDDDEGSDEEFKDEEIFCNNNNDDLHYNLNKLNKVSFFVFFFIFV